MKRHSGFCNPNEKTEVKKSTKYMSETKLKEITTTFLSSKKHSNIALDLLDQFRNPSQTPAACVTAAENLFIEVLRRRDMTATDEVNLSKSECQYKEWLRGCYEDALDSLSLCLQKGKYDSRLQALNSLFNLLRVEASNPIMKLKKKKKTKTNFPLDRLKKILNSLSSSSNIDQGILKRMKEFFEYKDVRMNVWLAVDSLLKDVCKQQPPDKWIWNILLILSQLPKSSNASSINLCDLKNVLPDERVVRTAVGAAWQELARWQYSSRTHQLLMVILVEHMMPLMDNVIFLTDYFMDALDRDECEINMLALQGIFNLVLKHNIEYPDIYGKLYQLFTIDALKAKYKTRLFALTDDFLKSTHLPLALVAAFAKRFSRLLLVATPPDLLILLTFILNLLLRHPDLLFLIHKPNAKDVESDPYQEQEKDPVKSRACDSQLWEVQLIQHHYAERVARLASFINNDLPSVEFPLEPLFELPWMEMIKKDALHLKRKIPQVAEKYDDKQMSVKFEEGRRKEIESIFTSMRELFVF